MNSRAMAATALAKIIRNGKNIDSALSDIQDDKPFIQTLVYGACRHYHHLRFIAEQLLKKSFHEKDSDLLALVIIGLLQLEYLDIAQFAAINESVDAAKQLNKEWAANVINAVLRNFLRQREKLLAQQTESPSAQFSHPAWFIKMVQQDWPEHWQNILQANQQHAPMVLRVNAQQQDRTTYLKSLHDEELEAHAGSYSSEAIYLEKPVDIKTLPGFENGSISVQDEAAQLAAHILNVKPQQRVLDACAAPGGKTCHLLELEPSLKLTALDNSAARSERIVENLQRLQLEADVKVADASEVETWWDGELFDRILLDAPCSATGVIRRHPDIKLLRRRSDIKKIGAEQTKILNALWPLLAPGGILLYATCSVLKAENDTVITAFLANHPDAHCQAIEAPWGISTEHGRQCLPGSTDGFYYAKIAKTP